jgi:hypothetical protein
LSLDLIAKTKDKQSQLVAKIHAWNLLGRNLLFAGLRFRKLLLIAKLKLCIVVARTFIFVADICEAFTPSMCDIGVHWAKIAFLKMFALRAILFRRLVFPHTLWESRWRCNAFSCLLPFVVTHCFRLASGYSKLRLLIKTSLGCMIALWSCCQWTARTEPRALAK